MITEAFVRFWQHGNHRLELQFRVCTCHFLSSRNNAIQGSGRHRIEVDPNHVLFARGCGDEFFAADRACGAAGGRSVLEAGEPRRVMFTF